MALWSNHTLNQSNHSPTSTGGRSLGLHTPGAGSSSFSPVRRLRTGLPLKVSSHALPTFGVFSSSEILLLSHGLQALFTPRPPSPPPSWLSLLIALWFANVPEMKAKNCTQTAGVAPAARPTPPVRAPRPLTQSQGLGVSGGCNALTLEKAPKHMFLQRF